MKVPFHPRSATRSTMRPPKNADDDDLYLLETATTAAQALPVSNLSKCRPSSRGFSIASVSSKQGLFKDSLVDCSQEAEEPIIPVPDVTGRHKPGNGCSGLISQNDADDVSLQSSSSGHRHPRGPRTVAGLGEAGLSNLKSQSTGHIHPTHLHMQYGAHYNSPRNLQGDNDPIRAPYTLPKPPLPYAVCSLLHSFLDKLLITCGSLSGQSSPCAKQITRNGNGTYPALAL
jgi:hypothetical protein